MSSTDVRTDSTNTPADSSNTAAATTAADDVSAVAAGTRTFGGMTIGWNTLLTTVPIYVGLIAVWILFDVLTSGTFTGARNISDMMQEFSYKPVLALGVVFVLLLGEIDLSLGYLTLLSLTLTAQFSAVYNWPAGLAIIGAIVVCTLLGLAQGFLIAYVRMPAFVVTLGGFLIFEGAALFILAGSTIHVFDPFIITLGSAYLADWLGWVIVAVAVGTFALYGLLSRRSRSRAGLSNPSVVWYGARVAGLAVLLGGLVWLLNNYQGVPLPLAILGACAVLFWFFSRRTRFGRHIYAVGGNLEAARRAGINTTAVRWIVFGISGLMAGVAGVMLMGYGHNGSPNAAGPDLLLDVISIAVIGGVSLTGGKGSVWSVLLGGLVIASVDSGLNLLGSIDPSTVYPIKGGILLLAILIDVVGKRRGGLGFQR